MKEKRKLQKNHQITKINKERMKGKQGYKEPENNYQNDKTRLLHISNNLEYKQIKFLNYMT